MLNKGFGVPAADALAYGVILQAVEIATAVALGVPALVREGVTWSDMRMRAMSAAPVQLPSARAPASREPTGSPPSAARGPLTAFVSLITDGALQHFRLPAHRPQSRLKFATEGYWRGQTSADELAGHREGDPGRELEAMQDAGIDLIPSNDFSLYDQVLDTIALVGAVPGALRLGRRPTSTSTRTSRWPAAGRATAST